MSGLRQHVGRHYAGWPRTPRNALVGQRRARDCGVGSLLSSGDQWRHWDWRSLFMWIGLNVLHFRRKMLLRHMTSLLHLLWMQALRRHCRMNSSFRKGRRRDGAVAGELLFQCRIPSPKLLDLGAFLSYLSGQILDTSGCQL